MSRFFSKKFDHLKAYTPGEQPRDKKYIKLNTNESPFSPSELAQIYARDAINTLQLYPDPCCQTLCDELSDLYQISPKQIIFANGSDDILNFAFIAFCDKDHPAIFPEITYGFYQVFAEANQIPYRKIPLRSDFTIDIDDYIHSKGTVFIANPNAPTGIALNVNEIEEIVCSDPDRVVVIDEAYIDFGNDSVVSLIDKYDNLLITQTFSKSRSMAGARLGFAMGNEVLIRDLDTIKYSTNPYSVNSMTMACGIGILKDDATVRENCKEIILTRDRVNLELSQLGFVSTPSTANFIFTKHPRIKGEQLYVELKERGILVRHFSDPKISDYIRVTIGTRGQMEQFVEACRRILEERNEKK